MKDYVEQYEEDDEDETLYLGRYRPIRAKGLPNKKNERKSHIHYSDWDED